MNEDTSLLLLSVQPQEDPIPTPETTFPWCNYSDNYQVRGLKPYSMYNTLPGTSIMETAYPKQFYWSSQVLPQFPDVENLTNYTTVGVVLGNFSTDVYTVGIFDGAKDWSCEDLFLLQLDKSSSIPHTITVYPGLDTYVEGVACDQLNNSVSLKTFFSESVRINGKKPSDHYPQGHIKSIYVYSVQRSHVICL